MAIEFNCPHCQHAYRLKDELGGKTATCKTCRNKISIPAPATVPPTLTAEQLAAKEAEALQALADEKAKEADPAEQVIPVECQFCSHKWTEPLTRAGKNALCPNPECRQRVKIPEPKADDLLDWRQQRTNRPSLAKPAFEKPADAMDAGSTTLVSRGALDQAGAIDEDLEPRSLKRLAVFGFLVLALLGGAVYGVVYLFQSRTAGKEDKLMQEAVEEFAATPPETPDAALCTGLLHAVASEHAVRHDDPKKLKEALEHFAKGREAVRKAAASPARFAVAGELAASVLALGGSEQQARDQLRIRWAPEFTSKPRLNERLFTVHEELRQALALVQGSDLEFRTHLARRLTRELARAGQAALAAELLPVALFAAPEQDEARAVLALEVMRLDKDSPLPRKIGDELKPRTGEPARGGPHVRALLSLLDPDKGPKVVVPKGTGGIDDGLRMAAVVRALMADQPDEARELALRPGPPEVQLRALVVCADWSADPAPALDAAAGVAGSGPKGKGTPLPPFALLRLSQVAAEKGRFDQAKQFADLIADDGLKAWAKGSAVRARAGAAKERAEDAWAELPPAERPKDLRAGHLWGRLWVARHNTKLSKDRGAEVKAVAAWPAAAQAFGKAGVALGLQDK